MICPKCGSRLPDDSVFCQFCGVEISKVTTFAFDGTDPLVLSKEKTYILSEEIILDESQDLSDSTESKTAKHNPQLYENTASGSEIAEVPPKADFKPHCKRKKLVAACLLALLVTTNVAQLIYSIKLHSKTDLLEKQIVLLESENTQLDNQVNILENNNSELQSQISNLSSSKSDLQKEISKLNENNSLLRSRVNTLESSNASAKEVYNRIKNYTYGSTFSDYYPDKEVLIVKVGETKSFRITYTVSASSTVFYQSNNKNSTAAWGKEWENYSCAVSITGKLEGTTTYTFTNDYNTHTFKILVIILPKN